MVKKQHKFLCLVLCLALIATAVMVGAVSAFAASGDTVYVKANNGWTNLHCYMWNGNGEQKNADWPGVKMTEVGDGVYSYTLSGDFSKIIFNKGEGGNGNQTTDMDYPGANKIYDLSAGTWGDYGNTPTNPDPTNPTPTTPTPTTPTPTTPSGDNVVYFKNTDNWSVVKCYMWNSDSDKNAAWSGEEMTNLGDGVWMYTAKKKYAKCIFNNGNDQTDDLTANYGQIYDRSTKQWSPYDVNDLRITSFTADPASDVYTGSEVTLAAEAASKSSSNVFYKFSVTNASGGSSVVSDFSTAKSVSWTPTAAGSYTVTLDVKDDAGNDNSRTLSLTVAPDTGVTNPIIKKVTPANLNLIKMGSTATVSVTAGGGQTGTNLLFYKYVVTDPNGVPNVPYYTLNNTYQFKPSMKGNYTVDVFVQASDNSTISKTYTYTSTDGNIPTPTEPVTQPQPTTQKPTTTTPVPTTVPATTSAPTPTVAPTTSPSGYRFGDANQDGDVNIMDVTYIQKHCAEYADARTIDLSLADINRDGIMTVSDATALQYILAT
ncbi:starch-binding protein [uncultured Ruminococcus sp.]|uniref:starch-binding protein n=1 Tax=uncultured Ruminococcus sp. TaxID=165186 RepID=UPI00292E1948|nr:starch-binding protein [uncultured Ruminococcus sp.]